MVHNFFFLLSAYLISCDVRKTCAALEGPKYLTPSHNPSPTRKREEMIRLVASNGLCTSTISLLCNGKLDTLALGQGDPWLLRANDKDVVLTCGERIVDGVLDMDDVEASVVALTVGDDSNAAHVTTTSRHGNDTGIELDKVCDLASGEINLHSVVDLSEGVRVANTKGRILSVFCSKLIHQPSI